MDRDVAHREVSRLIQEYRSRPYVSLLELADGEVLETDIMARGELITLSVDVRHAPDNAVRIHVSAYGSNWWKQDRVDESVLVPAPPTCS